METDSTFHDTGSYDHPEPTASQELLVRRHLGNSAISRMGISTSRISTVIDLIDEIVSKTDLLAASAAKEIKTLIYDLVHGAEQDDDTIRLNQRIGSLEVLTAEEAMLYARHIPSAARDIADVIGIPSTVLLLSRCRGNTLACHGKDFSFLLELLGHEAAYKLKKWARDVPLTVPICRGAERAVIRSRIRAEFDRLTIVDKLSARKAVRNLTHSVHPPMHERTIWRILNKVDE